MALQLSKTPRPLFLQAVEFHCLHMECMDSPWYAVHDSASTSRWLLNTPARTTASCHVVARRGRYRIMDFPDECSVSRIPTHCCGFLVEQQLTQLSTASESRGRKNATYLPVRAAFRIPLQTTPIFTSVISAVRCNSASQCQNSPIRSRFSLRSRACARLTSKILGKPAIGILVR